MAKLLMPKATAVWLIDNTTLTFDQISDFTGLHSLEVQAIADGEVATGMQGMDPLANGQLTQEEIDRCETDVTARLQMLVSDLPEPVIRQKGPRYTPVSKRADKPDAIAWLLRHHPELSDAQVGRLIGTTKPTIQAIRDRSHWNSSNLRPRSPVELGLCRQEEMSIEIQKAIKAGRKPLEQPIQETFEEEPAAAPGWEGLE
ncbi:DUF1013 domain-containing protein [Hwanghaeella grinnelliae]|uniref:DUF1013 domain-containing protein n=1 Tax=Hwanghaeella grinnelliae TaxID=2500179 RepID=A0A437QVB9_9PROT|nr:DUF1013 domain-containing protein [Hwanghaeella grinnelliae]RVU38455.1 DUF1013 domain-containing protein [Hwanghaeella grinnelliae]